MSRQTGKRKNRRKETTWPKLRCSLAKRIGKVFCPSSREKKNVTGILADLVKAREERRSLLKGGLEAGGRTAKGQGPQC